MRLTSEAFVDGGPIPREYTCDGDDRSPLLQWTGAPRDAKSFVLLVDDPDAPGGLFRHWACYDIPAITPRSSKERAGPRGSRIFDTA
jgi:phosphatidylethanolamine-binding protein (PEBP) family uncharacterized protein